ncbi:hypothetical protein [Kribbella sp. DT2]|uniref:hypothetical protein n=1 Tax=Kribbella sp. DT2 TaxID=3393427 RepID=UPI003CF7BF66
MTTRGRSGDKASRSALRRQLHDQGCGVDEVAAEFRQRWAYSTLASYRYAVEMSQADVARRYNEAADDPRASADSSLISKLEQWPGQGGKAPTIYNLVLLAQAYDVAPHQLVSPADVSQLPSRDRIALAAMRPAPTSASVVPARPQLVVPAPVEPERDASGLDALTRTGIRQLVRQLPSRGRGPVSAHLLDSIDQLRRGTDDVLSAGTVTGSRMTIIEAAVDQLRRDHVHHSPNTMLAALLPEFFDVVSLTEHRQTARIRSRLAGATAQLATLAADSLMKLGETADSHSWYRTAQLAGDDTEDRALRAQIRAQEAMLPYYYGDLPRTIHLAQEAQRIAGNLPCAAACLAAAAEGRAWARLGNRDAAEQAIARAQEIFNQIPDPDSNDAFAFPEKRLLLYLSGALTHLDEPDRAAPLQDRALQLYSAQGGAFVLDPTLIQLDRAAGLASIDAVGACELTQETLESVPPGHRTQIVLTRGSDVLSALPRNARALPAADDLREVLALTSAAQ